MFRSLPKNIWLALLGPLVATTVLAQAGYVPGGGYYNRPYYGYGGGYRGGWGAGSTAAGSYYAGMASAIRAQGQYNLDTSAAAINLEEAQKKDMENRQQWTNTYFEMRKINEAYTEAHRPARGTPDDWVRLAHDSAPSRIPTSALDPVTGQIVWPIALLGDVYQPQREALDQWFAQRASSHGAIGANSVRQIRDTTDRMLNTLKDHIREFDTKTYLEARNFLSSLAYEATFPAG